MNEGLVAAATEADHQEVHEGPQCLVSLVQGVYLAQDPDGGSMLINWPRQILLGVLHEDERLLLSELANNDHLVALHSLLSRSASARDGRRGALLRRLSWDGWLSYTIDNGNNWVQVIPRRPPSPISLASDTRLCPSRHLVMFQSDSVWRLDAPHSWCDLRFSSLPWFSEVMEAASAESDLDPGLRNILQWAGVFVDPEEEAGHLKSLQWSPHELWFHERSRRYGRERAYGGTFWASGTFPPLPYRQEDLPEPEMLFEPIDTEELAKRSSSTYSVMESRRTLRVHDDASPMTKEQLGEFLYRTARTRMIHEKEGVEYASRVYPSGGAAYETEIYVLVRLIAGISPGLWRYDSQRHGLMVVQDSIDHVDVSALLNAGTHSSTVKTGPQVQLLFAPRFGRIMWKYEQISYSVMLKNLGVLMQTMSLVAADMGLASCIVGSGDSDVFSRATGLDPLECTSIGEMLLGSCSFTELNEMGS